MLIQTSRFGQVELTEEDIIHFSEGLIGFNSLRQYVLLDDPNDEIFAWLQSCENPSVAFPVLEPELFAAGYKVDLNRYDLESLQLADMKGSRTFVIVTIPADPKQMTANLKAPLVVNAEKRLARQCVLQDSQLNIREPIFSKLQQRVVAGSGQSIKDQSGDWEVAIKLPMDQTMGADRPAEIK